MREFHRIYEAANQDLNSGSTELVVPVLKPMRVHRAGVINDNSNDIPTDLNLQVVERSTPGDSGSDTVLDGTNFEISPSSAVARGDGLTYTNGSRDVIEPGSQLVLKVETVAGGTSTGDLFLEVEERGYQDADHDNMTELNSAWT